MTYPSECKLRREPNPARPAASEEGITDAHVAGCNNLVPGDTHFTVAAAVKTARTTTREIRSRICHESRQERICKVRMVENVKKLGSKLHAHTLRDVRALVDRKVPLLKR